MHSQRRESLPEEPERVFQFPLSQPEPPEPPFLEYVPLAARLAVTRRFRQQEDYYLEDNSDEEDDEAGELSSSWMPPLEWYVKELQKEVNQVAITMSDRVKTVKKSYEADPSIFKGEGAWGVLLETVGHFSSAAYHASSMASHLAREAGRAPVVSCEPHDADEAFAQLHTSISRLQAGTNRLTVALRRFKNNPEEIENYVDTAKLFALLPMVEFAAERSTALVNAMDRVKMVATTLTVSLAAMKLKRKAGLGRGKTSKGLGKDDSVKEEEGPSDAVVPPIKLIDTEDTSRMGKNLSGKGSLTGESLLGQGLGIPGVASKKPGEKKGPLSGLGSGSTGLPKGD